MGTAKEGGALPDDRVLEQIEMERASTLDAVGEVEAAAEALARRAGFDEDEACDIAMLTREAVINAVKHGNRFAPEKKVWARLVRTAGEVRISVADQGEGLDPESLPDPLDPANLLRSSGRGVFLMRAMMDEVRFRDLAPGTEVTLVKHVASAE
jgi:serine/threonine-protein kinase RsbW